MKNILSEIITIGDEILYGHILDTNAKWISEKLNEIGIKSNMRTTIGDNSTQIKEILKSSLLGDLFQVSFRMRPGDGQGKDAYLSRQPYFQKMERFMIH